MLDVTVILLNDNYASTALGPIEVFHSAGQLWNVLRGDEPETFFRVTVASMDGGSVTSPYGVGLSPQVSIHDVQTADIIVVPASGLNLDAQFRRHRDLMPWLSDWHSNGAYIASICSGAAYLAEAGLLDGRDATTHWAVAETYERRYPNVNWRPEMFITEDQRVLCSGGVYASIDLSLYLVEKFCGHEVALRCAKTLLVSMPRKHQSGYAFLPLSRPHSDDKIKAIEAYIDEHFARDLTIEMLADQVNMTPRTFLRRFKLATGRNPGEYVQSLRIAVAKEMLESDEQSVEAVSRAVGYDDSAFFRSLFKRHTGITPGEYRTRFAGSVPRVSR
jgi:transcriptional regulator GlxA family with amidase domain